MVKGQIHTKFKVFIGPPSVDGMLGAIQDEVERFASTKAAKSIGVEYLEAKRQIVLSLGYREDETPYPVQFSTVSLGRMSGDLNPETIAQAMGAAAEHVQNVICHEFYVREDGEFFMVLMSHRA